MKLNNNDLKKKLRDWKKPSLVILDKKKTAIGETPGTPEENPYQIGS